MDRIDVALATFAARPDPAPDDQLLVDALRRAGRTVEARPWTDVRRPWTSARLTVVRSTWDYYLHRPDFLRWIRRVALRSEVWNPPEVLVWNTDKRYLRALAAKGVPVVPSVEVRPGGPVPSWPDLVAALGGSEVIVKPRISADGHLTRRFGQDAHRAARQHLAKVLSTGPALVQRYLPAVEDFGERSLIYLDGRFSHSVRRTPILEPGGRGAPEPARPAPPAAKRLADRVLAAVKGERLLYARVDLVPDPEGTWRLLELELTEPTLYLDRDPRAPERLARGIARRLDRLGA
ncbi:MAG TPA: hypothetical protein VMH90_05725 [Thermoplasmata archaeon]|nr:hypothetical protein [Thermoplasmata archaeon]